jgi:hypothetical protein
MHQAESRSTARSHGTAPEPPKAKPPMLTLRYRAPNAAGESRGARRVCAGQARFFVWREPKTPGSPNFPPALRCVT